MLGKHPAVFFLCTFLAYYVNHSDWTHVFWPVALTPARTWACQRNNEIQSKTRKVDGVNRVSTQWWHQSASSESSCPRGALVMAELYGVVLGEVVERKPSVLGDYGSCGQSLLKWPEWGQPQMGTAQWMVPLSPGEIKYSKASLTKALWRVFESFRSVAEVSAQ